MGVKGQNASKRNSCGKVLFQQSLWTEGLVNALQFKDILRQKLTAEQEKALVHAQNYISQISHGSKLDHYLRG